MNERCKCGKEKGWSPRAEDMPCHADGTPLDPDCKPPCPTCGSMDGVALWRCKDNGLSNMEFEDDEMQIPYVHFGWHPQTKTCVQDQETLDCLPCPTCSAKLLDEAKRLGSQSNTKHYSREAGEYGCVECVSPYPPGLGFPENSSGISAASSPPLHQQSETQKTLPLEEVQRARAALGEFLAAMGTDIGYRLLDKALRTAEAALLREAELREALKQIAEVLRYIENSDAPETDEISMRFTVAQFERAAQALAKKP